MQKSVRGIKFLSVVTALAVSAFMLVGCGGSNPVESSGASGELKRFADYEEREYDERLVHDGDTWVLKTENTVELLYFDDWGLWPEVSWEIVDINTAVGQYVHGKDVSWYTVEDEHLYIIDGFSEEVLAVYSYTVTDTELTLTGVTGATGTKVFTKVDDEELLDYFFADFELPEGAGFDTKIVNCFLGICYGEWYAGSDVIWEFTVIPFLDMSLLSIDDQNTKTSRGLYWYTLDDHLHLLNPFTGSPMEIYSYEVSSNGNTITLTNTAGGEVITLSAEPSSSIKQRGRQLAKGAGGVAANTPDSDKFAQISKGLIFGKKR